MKQPQPDFFDLYAKADLVSSLLSFITNDLESIRSDEAIKKSSRSGDLEHIVLQLYATEIACSALAGELERLDSSAVIQERDQPDKASKVIA